jgi:hypothetical protein
MADKCDIESARLGFDVLASALNDVRYNSNKTISVLRQRIADLEAENKRLLGRLELQRQTLDARDLKDELLLTEGARLMQEAAAKVVDRDVRALDPEAVARGGE